MFVYKSIYLKDVLEGNLAIIFNYIEQKEVQDGSNSNEVLNIKRTFSHNKLHRGFSIIPITKLFKEKKLKNGEFFNIAA